MSDREIGLILATYKDNLIKAMNLLSEHPNTIFLGQEADDYYGTMLDVPTDKILVLPIMEDVQLGMSIGLSLEGVLPISLYTRMDFFLLAMNQLINHLDKISHMSNKQFEPKVVIRVLIGESSPIDWGPQHTQDFTELLKHNLKTITVVSLETKEQILPCYRDAMDSAHSTILIESKSKYAQ